MAGFTGTALAIASLVGIGTSVAGGIMSSQAQRQQGQDMAMAEARNAAVANQTAEAIRVSGQYEADKQRRENAIFLGRQRALTAKSGVRFAGSPLDVMSDTIAQQELDLAALDYNTKVGMSRAKSQADYSNFLGSSYAQQGQIAGNESLFKAGTTLLTSGADWANKYAGAFKYNKGTK